MRRPDANEVRLPNGDFLEYDSVLSIEFEVFELTHWHASISPTDNALPVSFDLSSWENKSWKERSSKFKAKIIWF